MASKPGICAGRLSSAAGAVSSAATVAVAPTIATGCTSRTLRLTTQPPIP